MDQKSNRHKRVSSQAQCMWFNGALIWKKHFFSRQRNWQDAIFILRNWLEAYKTSMFPRAVQDGNPFPALSPAHIWTCITSDYPTPIAGHWTPPISCGNQNPSVKILPVPMSPESCCEVSCHVMKHNIWGNGDLPKPLSEQDSQTEVINCQNAALGTISPTRVIDGYRTAGDLRAWWEVGYLGL